MFCAVARLFRPGYVDALVLEWLPGLDGVIDKRKTGATVADGENINPVEGLYYSASTMICVPTSIAQETGLALGAQAGEKRLTEVIRSRGFTHVRRSAQTPLNMVLEAT